MGIPAEITRANVLEALAEIRRAGVPKQRESEKFDLIADGAAFPPKYVVSIAGRIATGTMLEYDAFRGGEEVNEFLRKHGFQVQEKTSDWSELECYFAVWGYDQLDIDRSINKSALYREISELMRRSPAAVAYKIQNVAHFDDRPRSQKPVAAAAHTQALLGEVFKWYWADRERGRAKYGEFLQKRAFGATKAAKLEGQGGVDPSSMIIEEGATGHQESMRRSRSRQLLEYARSHFRAQEKDGRLRCRACGFASPSDADKELVQLHHMEPIGLLGRKGRQMALAEAVKKLLPLCPTCHSVAHLETPPLPLERIRIITARQGVSADR